MSSLRHSLRVRLCPSHISDVSDEKRLQTYNTACTLTEFVRVVTNSHGSRTDMRYNNKRTRDARFGAETRAPTTHLNDPNSEMNPTIFFYFSFSPASGREYLSPVTRVKTKTVFFFSFLSVYTPRPTTSRLCGAQPRGHYVYTRTQARVVLSTYTLRIIYAV